MLQSNTNICSKGIPSLGVFYTFTTLWDLLWVSILTYYLWNKKGCFPIKERSPLLTIASLYSYLFYIDPVPWFYLFRKYYQNDKSGVYLQFIIQDIGLSSFILILMFKQLRLYFAFQANEQQKINSLFRNQTYILLTLLLILTLSLLIFILSYFFLLADGHSNSQQLYRITLDIYQIIKLSLLYAFSIIIIVIGFIFRRIPCHYQLRIESFFLIFLFLFLFNFNYYSFYSGIEKNLTAYICSDTNTEYFILWLLFCGYTIFTIVIPLYRSTHLHKKLPTSLILDEFDHFIKVQQLTKNQQIQERRCIRAFSQYLLYLDENISEDLVQFSNSYEQSSNYTAHPFKKMLAYFQESKESVQYGLSLMNSEWICEEYLHLKIFQFYLDVLQKEIFSQFDVSVASNIIEEYFIGKQTETTHLLLNQFSLARNAKERSAVNEVARKDQQPILDSAKQPTFDRLYEQLVASQNHELIVQIVVDYFNIAHEYLEQIYKQQFQKTHSFKIIKEELAKNESIGLNLFRYNMTVLQTQPDTLELSLLE